MTCGEYMEKVAFSVTPEGHKLDNARYQAASDYFGKGAKAEKEFRKKAPVRSYLNNGIAGIFAEESLRNKSQYLADKHKKGKNSYNPFAGWTDEEMKKNKKKSIKK